MRRLVLIPGLVVAFVACGSTGSGGGAPDGAAQSVGDDALAQHTSDAAQESGEEPDAVSGDAQSEPAPAPDGGTAALPDGGVCPASCSTPTDCNSCPQKAFGGWSCNNGLCQFMG